MEVDGEEEWEVEEVLDARITRNRLRYLIRWKGYDEDTWEPADSVNGLEQVDRFHERYPNKPGPLPE